MPPRLIRLAAAVAAFLLLGSCAVDPPRSEPPRPHAADPFRESDVPEGSSGVLVAALDDRMVTCRGWGAADRESGTPAGCDTVYDSCR